ncbi:uncharacterized protein LOC132279993 [Cornus florida]|uniref:uncharacterized protein LOC132279993 n=1 Tax=Cornus florida TaxID=4283 RepID=UPI00289700E7|nr:uncharacterized protein LOC132279993 [Cornus florida]XP_059638064.1 uncharacterized protein LOC132279993 [Cornus florida]XP_059638065.1 uncharacterized protein LOC132279993 [Cornus florida]XP_059638066.1 uncharacterized protein LOC132279993 [Cornus florida]XP_059638067.1 uncharacterized protein LOC132279993 [Cornus florida]
MESSLAASESLIETLISRGWSFGDVDQVKALIVIQSALHGETLTIDLLESELANMDLRSIGGKSLPDPSLLRKSSHLQGPKVLQISSARDVSRSSVADSSGNSNNQRLLRLVLTDGHSEITAIEFSHIPSVPDDVVPGTKVRLENKAVIHGGIVCLNPKVITVLGGVVESLYEEWQMNKKYSGFSRSSLRRSQESDTSGPPPFEKLKVRLPSLRSAQQGRFSLYPGSTSKSSGPIPVEKGGNHEFKQINMLQKIDNRMDDDVKLASHAERSEEKPSSSEARLKEVAESLPVQNQAAAQKLLQKMSQPNWDNHRSRGRKHRGKGREEESPVYTLDEWERKKAGPNPSMRDELRNVSQDEALARQLQNQLDLEDLQAQGAPQKAGAEDIRMSMFNFERDDAKDHGRMGSRGRGRGRGGGRGRGRGRGRGGGRFG